MANKDGAAPLLYYVSIIFPFVQIKYQFDDIFYIQRALINNYKYKYMRVLRSRRITLVFPPPPSQSLFYT